jgi:hypothetical protein
LDVGVGNQVGMEGYLEVVELPGQEGDLGLMDVDVLLVPRVQGIAVGDVELLAEALETVQATYPFRDEPEPET